MSNTDTAFTPVDTETGRRLIMYLSKEDMAQDWREEPALVMDQATGRFYIVEPKDCGADCHCDAWATEIDPAEIDGDEAAAYMVEVDSVVAARAENADGMVTEPEIENLKSGDMVKAIFASAEDGGCTERMWVQIASIEDGQIIGLLRNEPAMIEGLEYDSLVTFPAVAVVDIHSAARKGDH